MSGQIEDYEVLEVIGTGSFGTCYKVRNKLSGKIYVWKAIDYGKMTEEKKQVRNSILIYVCSFLVNIYAILWFYANITFKVIHNPNIISYIYIYIYYIS